MNTPTPHSATPPTAQQQNAELQASELPIADIHLPNDVSAWPPAIGWWLLVLISALLFWAAIVAFKKHQNKWQYRKAALRLLAEEYRRFNDTNTQATATALISVLKRTAMSAYPEQDLRGIYGQQWVSCLNRQTPKAYFEANLASYFIDQQYQIATTEHNNIDVSALYHACQCWIKQHNTQFQQEAQ